jgi:hypothetical protein
MTPKVEKGEEQTDITEVALNKENISKCNLNTNTPKKKSSICKTITSPVSAATISHVTVDQEIIQTELSQEEQYLSLTSKGKVLFSAVARDPAKAAVVHNILNAALTQLLDAPRTSSVAGTSLSHAAAPSSEPESFHNIILSSIRAMTVKAHQKDIWENSPYKDFTTLQINDRGIVGETGVNNVCRATGIDADCDGSKTKKIGGGEGDGTIMNIPVEIKTAHQGCKSSSFQHELGEVPWRGAKYMIFVDIATECIYLTIFKNFDEKTYKSKEKLPRVFTTKKITWRKEQGAFKLDTTVKINEQSVKDGHAIKITPTTSNDTIASFIRKSLTEIV